MSVTFSITGRKYLQQHTEKRICIGKWIDSFQSIHSALLILGLLEGRMSLAEWNIKGTHMVTRDQRHKRRGNSANITFRACPQCPLHPTCFYSKVFRTFPRYHHLGTKLSTWEPSGILQLQADNKDSNQIQSQGKLKTANHIYKRMPKARCYQNYFQKWPFVVHIQSEAWLRGHQGLHIVFCNFDWIFMERRQTYFHAYMCVCVCF